MSEILVTLAIMFMSIILPPGPTGPMPGEVVDDIERPYINCEDWDVCPPIPTGEPIDPYTGLLR